MVVVSSGWCVFRYSLNSEMSSFLISPVIVIKSSFPSKFLDSFDMAKYILVISFNQVLNHSTSEFFPLCKI